MLNTSRKILLCHLRRNHTLPSAWLQTKFQRKPMRLYSSDTGDTYNLNKPEACTYLESVLGIPDPGGLLSKNKEVFLNDLVQQTMRKIPFTRIPHFKGGKFRTLSIEEIKKAMFKREGGDCSVLNTSAVLECLGFDVYLIGGSAQRWKLPLFLNHGHAIIVKDLTIPGSLHLFDVGSRYSFPLIALDFERVSQVYPMKKWQYRFFQVSPGVVQLTSKCDRPKPGRADGMIYAERDEYWEVMITFQTLKQLKLAECWSQHEIMAQNAHMFPGTIDGFVLITYPNNLLFNITNNICKIETETGNIKVTRLKNFSHALDTILKYFPQYSRSQLESMADYFAKKSHEKII